CVFVTEDQTDKKGNMSTETPAALNPLTELVNALKAFQPTPAPPSASGSPMAMPATFAGEAAECSGFLLQVNLFIQMQPRMFPSENAKVAFLISLLTGKALQWAKAIWNSDNPIIHSHEPFTSHFSEVFSTTTGTFTNSDQLFRLQQGTSSVNDYTLHFRTLAAASGWNETALLGAYRQGLPDPRHSRCYGFVRRQKPPGLPRTSPFITLQIGLFHPEEMRFLVLEDSTVCIILGRPWLQKHRPEVSWGPCDIICWSEHCQTNCLVNLAHSPSVPVLLSSTQLESLEPAFTPEIPAEYMAFQDVFSKQAATHLPPHRSRDCAIELLPGAQLPKGRVYLLSIPGGQAMEEYIAEALSQGFIQPSTSLQASSSWARRIEVCVPASITDNSVPRSDNNHIRSLCFVEPNAYNLVRIRAGDEWKTAFVTPTEHYEYRVMAYCLSISPSVFQTFMNEVFRELLHRFVVVYIDDILIYSRNLAEHCQHVQQPLPQDEFSWDTSSMPRACRWIRGKSPPYKNGHNLSQSKSFNVSWDSPISTDVIQNYSSIMAPLTSLLRGKPKNLIWNPAAHEAFQRLKETTGVGAVLSLVVGEPPLLHPCAFYSRKLSPAEQNYDVGNRELLAIKLALEEWRHWLEGSTHPFTIITDYKNLQYLREARHLNPRQARWALFFTRFNFKITY
ncbi:hypothetical protein M9458_033437, partial [Cirrhinus mrigala]